MAQMEKAHPDVVAVVEYGKTYEKKTISLLKVGPSISDQKNLKILALVSDGGAKSCASRGRSVRKPERKRRRCGWTAGYTPGSGSPRPSASTLSAG